MRCLGRRRRRRQDRAGAEVGEEEDEHTEEEYSTEVPDEEDGGPHWREESILTKQDTEVQQPAGLEESEEGSAELDKTVVKDNLKNGRKGAAENENYQEKYEVMSTWCGDSMEAYRLYRERNCQEERLDSFWKN